MTRPGPSELGSILVTGAGGFIGARFVESLIEDGHRVTALDTDLARIQHLSDADGCSLLTADIGDSAARRKALAGVETVFHLAAAHLGARRPIEEFRNTNVEATRSLAEESNQKEIRRFVHCSTVGVFGRITDPPADEKSPCRPELAYETTKLEGELAVLELTRSHQLPAVVLRPVWVYGPGCGRTQKLFRAIARKRFVVAGDGLAYRHCIYVDDFIDAMLSAAVTPAVVGEVLVIGDDRPATVRELVDQIASLTNAKRPPSVPYPVFFSLALMCEWAFRGLGREPPISRRTLRFFTANTAFRTDKARQLLPFRPQYDLQQGLAETYRQLQFGAI